MSGNWQQKWGQLVAKSWEDEKLHDRLINDTAAVLKENGIDMPAGVQVKVVQNTNNVIHLPMPPRPSGDEISEEELAAVAGGVAQTCSITYFGKGATNPNINPAANPATRLNPGAINPGAINPAAGKVLK
jgi:hypothetical protein